MKTLERRGRRPDFIVKSDAGISHWSAARRILDTKLEPKIITVGQNPQSFVDAIAEARIFLDRSCELYRANDDENAIDTMLHRITELIESRNIFALSATFAAISQRIELLVCGLEIESSIRERDVWIGSLTLTRHMRSVLPMRDTLVANVRTKIALGISELESERLLKNIY